MRGSIGGVSVEAFTRLASNADATATTEKVARMVQIGELGGLMEELQLTLNTGREPQ
jgi:hypothetical protein